MVTSRLLDQVGSELAAGAGLLLPLCWCVKAMIKITSKNTVRNIFPLRETTLCLDVF